jgi:hypothetical protein
MKSTFALALVLLLASPPNPVFAQQTPFTAPGPIALAAAREGARFALQQTGKPAPDVSWRRVQRLAAGTIVMLTVGDASPALRTVIGATDDRLLAMNLAHPAITATVWSILRAMAARGTADFLMIQSGGTFSSKGVRIGRDGVFVEGAKIAELSAIVETHARDDVRLVTRSKRNRMALVGAATGTAVGFVAGVYVALRLVFKYCGDSCVDEKVGIGLALAGLPAAGGILGYMAAKRDLTEVIYRGIIDPAAGHGR